MAGAHLCDFSKPANGLEHIWTDMTRQVRNYTPADFGEVDATGFFLPRADWEAEKQTLVVSLARPLNALSNYSFALAVVNGLQGQASPDILISCMELGIHSIAVSKGHG